MFKKLVCTIALCVSAGAFAQIYDLPILFIDSKQKCLDFNIIEKIPATIKVLDGKSNNVTDSSKGIQYDIGIKVRGQQNSAYFPKPNYSIEFHDATGKDRNVSLLGLPPSDDWVLHGAYIDKSMIRNTLAHWLFRQTGRYSPRTKYFDLYINGVYRGVYVLIERIKRGKYRVNVSKLKETDIEGDELTGGYIWEFDMYREARLGAGARQPYYNPSDFTTSDRINVVLRYPLKKKIAEEQEEYLKNYLNELEALFKDGKNGSGYENYVDISSAADYILHQEITRHVDAFAYNFFMHKPKDKTDEHGNKTQGKITLGPPWDFELAFANDSRPESSDDEKKDTTFTTGFVTIDPNDWIIETDYKMFSHSMGLNTNQLPNWLIEIWKDSVFQTEVSKRWAELRSGVWHTKTIDAYLDSMKTFLTSAAERNFKRWPNLGKVSAVYDDDPEPMKYCDSTNNQAMKMPLGGYNADTWNGEFEHVRTKIKERMKLVDERLGFTEPANPVVTGPVDPEIHEPHWQKDIIPDDTIPNDTVPPIRLKEFGRLSPTNFFDINGNNIEVHSSLGGTFALIDLNGVVLYKTRIKKGLTILKIPANARNKAWIATLNGKMMNR